MMKIYISFTPFWRSSWEEKWNLRRSKFSRCGDGGENHIKKNRKHCLFLKKREKL